MTEKLDGSKSYLTSRKIKIQFYIRFYRKNLPKKMNYLQTLTPLQAKILEHLFIPHDDAPTKPVKSHLNSKLLHAVGQTDGQDQIIEDHRT